MGWIEEGPWEPTPIEKLAAASGLDYWALRSFLEREVDRRRRKRYSMYARAYAALDKQLGHVAASGDAPETTPRPHQGGI